MAGLFGSLPSAAERGAVLGQFNPQAMSTGDRLAMFGAMLKDIGNFGQSSNISDVQQMIAGRQYAGNQLALMNLAMGGGDAGAGGFMPSKPQEPVPGGGQGSFVPPGTQQPPPQGALPMAPQAAAPQPGAGMNPMAGMSPAQRAMATLAMLKGDTSSAWNIMHPTPVVAREGSAVMDPVTGRVIGYGPSQVVTNGSYTGKVDPRTGEVTWGGQRPMTYGENLDQQKFIEQLLQDKFANEAKTKELGIQSGQLGVAQGNLGVNRGRLNLETAKTPNIAPPSGFVLDK